MAFEPVDYIFDLDNTLYAASQLYEHVRVQMQVAAKSAGVHGTAHSKIKEAALHHGFERALAGMDLTEAQCGAICVAYRSLRAPEGIVRYPDVRIIQFLRGRKFLVTSGPEEFQQSKVDELRIRALFKEVIVVQGDKKPAFEAIRDRYKLKPNKTIVVGDSDGPGRELFDGMQLGMVTVQILRGAANKGNAHFHIKSLVELEILDRHLNP